ncbi:hypothetical protein [Streptomyces sp. NPDC000133]|uniref:hypothetical protein n=1 Tax=Streptomyces sp. NPDC000133 TaxID=3364535 RepID=UPI0036CFBADE
MAASLYRLPAEVLRRVRLLVRPDTVLRWRRDLVARCDAAASRPNRSGRLLDFAREAARYEPT